MTSEFSVIKFSDSCECIGMAPIFDEPVGSDQSLPRSLQAIVPFTDLCTIDIAKCDWKPWDSAEILQILHFGIHFVNF